MSDETPALVVNPNSSAERTLRIARPGNIARNLAEGERNSVQVFIDVKHPAPGDLTLRLRSPSGTAVVLNDAGSRVLVPGPQVFGLTVDTAESLEALVGEPTSGNWSLDLENRDRNDAVLAAWGIRFSGFVRGDTDRNGTLSVSDALRLLEHLFGSGGLACQKTADFNDDGSLTIGDAINLLRLLFGPGDAPAQPYPDPGEDLTPDDLSCNA